MKEIKVTDKEKCKELWKVIMGLGITKEDVLAAICGGMLCKDLIISMSHCSGKFDDDEEEMQIIFDRIDCSDDQFFFSYADDADIEKVIAAIKRTKHKKHSASIMKFCIETQYERPPVVWKYPD